MTELDRTKERLTYLRFLLGIMVVVQMALIGWLISMPPETNQDSSLIALFFVVWICCCFWIIHRQIERHIEEIRRL